jgi:S1-C subfamily serine protease
VVHRLDEVEVGFGDGSTQKAKVVGRNPYSDLALLQARDGGHPVEIGSSEELKAGQFVLAMANPHGGRPSVTSGIITGVNRHIGGWWRFSVSNAVVTDARLNPGYSGGPLLDVQGRMIGMNVAYVSNRGIAVPVDSVRKDVERISSGQGFRRAYLGIVSNPVSLPEDVSTRPEVNQESGLMIFSVESGSAAKKAGLALGDVLVKFGNHPVGDFQALESLLGEEAVGKETKLLVLRGEEPTELTIVPSVAE